MRLVIVKHVLVGCLFAGTFVACSDGPALPTSASTAALLNQSVLVAAVSPSASSPLAPLYLTKTCDAGFPVTPICTVVTSLEGPLPVGTQAYYTFALIDFETAERLSAKLQLTTPGGGGTADGHCTLSFKSGLGRCVLTGGTGDLAGFHANLDVSFTPATGITVWDGTYHFEGR